MSQPLIQELESLPDVAETLRRFADWPDCVLFDSASQRPELGRYSFLTADPFEFEERATATFGVDPLERLRGWSQRFQAVKVPGLPPFQGGVAGLLSYELGSAWERLRRPAFDEFELPCLAVGVYDWVIAWDHLEQRAWIISHGFPSEGEGRSWRAAERMSAVLEQLMSSPKQPHRTGTLVRRAICNQQETKQCDGQECPSYKSVALPGLAGLTSNFSKQEYLRAVERVIEYIHAGDIFQANLSQRLLFPADEDGLALYLRLRERNAAPFAGYFAHDDWVIASASPERFVSLRDGEVETRPIKGTRRRRHLPEADLYTEDELRESEKDQAENVMIVDLLRNDLSKVCAPGSIRVPKLCAVETYETVQHLVSVIRGSMEHDQSGRRRDAWDLLQATFPGGSVTGAPKVRAMQIIAELEPTVRGPYCGSLFYVGFDGTADSNILIRTFTVRRGRIQFPVGGGIVAQSDPVAEYEETLHKAEGMLRALRSK
ncbi:MAG: anthranilate synthase component I family protein [Planctomycetia bacterium]|nr:anthranilate synthase component I family protein [Planctomycetia bacterium]